MKFSWKIFGASRISALVAIATQAVALAEFERHLGQLSLSDAQQVESTCTNLIETSVDATTIYKNERSGTKSALADLFTKAKEFLTPEDHKAFGAALQGLSTTEQKQLQVHGFALSLLIKRTLSDEEQRVDGPESGWLMRDGSEDAKPVVGDNSVSNLALMVLDDFLPKSMQRTFLKALAKGRIQLRLMRLHAKVLEFHWINHQVAINDRRIRGRKSSVRPVRKSGPFRLRIARRWLSVVQPWRARLRAHRAQVQTDGDFGFRRERPAEPVAPLAFYLVAVHVADDIAVFRAFQLPSAANLNPQIHRLRRLFDAVSLSVLAGFCDGRQA